MKSIYILFGLTAMLWMVNAKKPTINDSLLVNQIATAPEPVTNNAVSAAIINDETFIYSFGGLDQTKLFSGIHKRSYRYNINKNTWLQLPNLPDTLGKIASAASLIKDKIYIIGGYHVFSDGHETSSDKVHRFNIKTNQFLTDGVPIPIPIDDHVQAVWRDSLIFVITGWSQKENVPNVQIYNPYTNRWKMGSSVPNSHFYKAFGANGLILKDTIFYFGGAAMGTHYPAQAGLRKGVINPKNPAEITWTEMVLDTSYNSYRMAATLVKKVPHFIGGSAVTYNYNGLSYDKTGGVLPHQTDFFYKNNKIYKNFNSLLPMDLRGLASVNDSVKFIFGGMEKHQKVSNKILKLTWK